MVTINDLTLAFHKHLYDNVGSVYLVYFSKQTEGESMKSNQYIQPIWGEIPRFLPVNIVTVVLKCQSIIDEDHNLIKLRQMADYCVEVYRKNFDDVGDTSNVIPVYQWLNNTPLQTGAVESFVDRVVELPVNRYDRVAVINIYIKLLVCGVFVAPQP